MKKNSLDKWLYFSIIVIGIYLLIRIIDQSKLITTFPLINNDLGSYVAQLHLLKVCGFHNLCPYWYNGFTTFLISSPGWQFFTLPIYWIFENILLTTYISFILMYILSFIFIYYLGKTQKFSLTKILFFFVIFFGNSMSIGNFIVTGRATAMMGWLTFLGLAAVIFYYKEHKINSKFVYFFIPLNFFAILSHYQEAVLAQILILSLFLIKKGYERLIIIFSFLLSLILSSFWWIPFLLSALNPSASSAAQYHQGKWFIANIIPKLEFTTQSITSLLTIIIPLILLTLFYFYWQQKNKSIKELLFYLPILILTILFWLRLTAFLPILNQISPDPFILLYIFFSVLLLLNTRFTFYPKYIKIVIILALILLPLANVIVSHTKTHYWDVFEHEELEEETLHLLEFITPDEKFLILNGKFLWNWNDRRGEAAYYYAYAPIYHNLSTASGYYYLIAPKDYIEKWQNLDATKDCNIFKELSSELNVNSIISYEKHCDFLKSCNLNEIKTQKYSCLYKL